MATDPAELEKIRKDGEVANDHNRRLYRNQKGGEVLRPNPYDPVTEPTEWKTWNAGYQYRDMVNDG